ncbi:hypothetical protein K474DRAFT_1709658 [Panus rudis PR-1116 ss-1]|nr:hypothetical protein K474DRAFT_1709658 [Panus rudis PR-1116 ss-1]
MSALDQLGIDNAEAIILLSRKRLETYFYFVLTSLFIYDSILAFPQEIRCIWQKKWSGTTLLYAVIRYSTMMDMVMKTLITTAPLQDVKGYAEQFWSYSSLLNSFTLNSCKAINITDAILLIMSSLGIAVFECLRVWAISGKNWILAIAVLLPALLAPAIDIYINSVPTTLLLITSGPLSACWILSDAPTFIYSSATVGVIARVGAIISDLIALIVTFLKTFGTIRAGQNTAIRTDFLSMLLYNGAIQFILLLTLNLINIIFDILNVTTDDTGTSLVIIVNEVLAPIIICRFILSLRTIHHQDGTEQTHSRSAHSTVRFATIIADDLGAPLGRDGLSFNSAELDEVLEAEGILTSDPRGDAGSQTEEVEMQLVDETVAYAK